MYRGALAALIVVAVPALARADRFHADLDYRAAYCLGTLTDSMPILAKALADATPETVFDTSDTRQDRILHFLAARAAALKDGASQLSTAIVEGYQQGLIARSLIGQCAAACRTEDEAQKNSPYYGHYTVDHCVSGCTVNNDPQGTVWKHNECNREILSNLPR